MPVLSYTALNNRAYQPSESSYALHVAGVEIRSIDNVVIQPLSVALISSGLAFNFPANSFPQIIRHQMVPDIVQVFSGCVNSTFRGEIKVAVYNRSQSDIFTIYRGAPVALLISVNQA